MPTSAVESTRMKIFVRISVADDEKRYHRYWQIPYHVLEITGDRRYLKKIGKWIKLLTLIYRWQEASN